MFRDREDAARQLAARLRTRKLDDPLVLAVPRGGVVLGAVLARALAGELDVVLARKLRAPYQPEFAIGAIGEDGEVCLGEYARGVPGVSEDYIRREREHQVAEIDRRKRLFRAVKPAAPVAGRSVILTDDGIATGSTILAALHVLRDRGARELIVAVPVAPPDTLETLASRCDHVECLLAPPYLGAISAFYDDFTQVEDDEVLQLLREAEQRRQASKAGN